MDRGSSHSISIHEILAYHRSFNMPIFQRGYCWGRSEIELFQEDIERAMTQEEVIFLGAIVLQTIKSGGGREPDQFIVIDGQQRLTSIFISLIILAEEAQKRGWHDESESLAISYIIHQLPSAKNNTKLVPTTKDYCQMNTILKTVANPSPNLHANYGANDGSLLNAWKSLKEFINSHLEMEDENAQKEQWDLIYDTITKKLELVEIVIRETHDPNEVFDRLNSKGQSLKITDLVRNEIFKRVSDDIIVSQNLHEHYWKPFEDSFSGKELDGYFFPFTLVKKPSAPKSRMFDTLSAHWSNTFGKKGEDNGKLIIEELTEYQESYFSIIGRKEKVSDKKLNTIWRTLEKLHRLPKTSVTFPFFLNLLFSFQKGKVSEKDLKKIVTLIHSFLIRRAVLGYEPTGLHSVFKNLWNNSDGKPDLVKKCLETKTIKFPDDREFEEAIIEGNLYDRKVSKSVLHEYELFLQNKSPEPLIPLPEFQMDHIIPKKRSKDGWAKIISDDDYQKFGNSWGNLVPLTAKGNNLKNTKSFEEAKKLLQKETSFKSTKEVFENNKKWDVEAIKKRSRNLAKWAIKQWPHNT